MSILDSSISVGKAVFKDVILKDTRVTELLKYRHWTSQSFNVSLGYNVDVYTETLNVRGIRLIATEKVVKELFTGLGGGDVVFMVDFDALPTNLSTKDQIIDANGVVFKVTEVTPVLNVFVAFRVEGTT